MAMERERLEKIISTYEELEKKLYDPAVIGDPKEYTRLMKERSNQSDLVEKARAYVSALDDIDAARELMQEEKDPDARAMLQEEVDENQAKLPGIEDEIKVMLIPGDPNDEKNTIVEIRAGVGGDEAGIFAGDLFAMYQRLASRRGWKIEPISASPSEAGGFKTLEFKVTGKKVYSIMKYESGVHRVQRVPKTESQGRIQTSTATVAVLPEADEIDIDIDPTDLRIDTYCSSGPGGQGVNTTYSAVRITHLPTGLVVQSQEQRSQIQNREVCMQVLRSRLYELELQKQQEEVGAARLAQIGHGDRAEKIRTYNQPQDRVTDHRIGFNSSYSGVLEGDKLDEVIEALATADRAERLAAAV
jgi:peptide chain release factor 1